MSVSLSLKLTGHSVLLSQNLGFNVFLQTRNSRVSMPFNLPKLKNFVLYQNLHRSSCSNGDNNAFGLSDASNHGGSEESNKSGQGESLTSNETLKRLRRYGLSGILSYGLLNTAYYLTTFLFVWFYIAPAPGKMGYLAAVERFLKMMAMVWAGSQVTKLLRAGGALALAPFVDSGLSWFTVKFKFESQGKAFLAIVGFCFGLAIILFFTVTLLSA
ncbi:Gag-Pol polyprotein/retrotransposon [Quillaja saponaria]|uniref:Gag-Pol polyprotein/retrotransposon n=1 Tax=Quillaja saponaria TaxID=32244 RepID=A0AAD7VNK8_QUISA|nr:Gag-Pol polyprotein/retrotransposon [Quillaja saponaria]